MINGTFRQLLRIDWSTMYAIWSTSFFPYSVFRSAHKFSKEGPDQTDRLNGYIGHNEPFSISPLIFVTRKCLHRLLQSQI